MLADLDALLRASGRHRPGAGVVPWQQMVAFGCVGGLLYGMSMGLYGGRGLQASYSGLKVPLLLFVSTVICLPSAFVVNTALGLRENFGAVLRGILSTQGTVAVCLGALAPITLAGYASSLGYDAARLLNGAMFALASLAGQMTLGRHYAPLVARDPRHRAGQALWLGLYWFVAIQMAWTLRPFVGAPGLPTVFLRPESWGNAYVQIFELVGRLLP